VRRGSAEALERSGSVEIRNEKDLQLVVAIAESLRRHHGIKVDVIGAISSCHRLRSSPPSRSKARRAGIDRPWSTAPRSRSRQPLSFPTLKEAGSRGDNAPVIAALVAISQRRSLSDHPYIDPVTSDELFKGMPFPVGVFETARVERFGLSHEMIDYDEGFFAARADVFGELVA
jgi:hypothetical protein